MANMVLATDDPLLPAFADEELASRRLQSLWRSPEAALATFEQLRYSTAEILVHVEAAAWERCGHRADGTACSLLDLVSDANARLEAAIERIAAIRS